MSDPDRTTTWKQESSQQRTRSNTNNRRTLPLAPIDTTTITATNATSRMGTQLAGPPQWQNAEAYAGLQSHSFIPMADQRTLQQQQQQQQHRQHQLQASQPWQQQYISQRQSSYYDPQAALLAYSSMYDNNAVSDPSPGLQPGNASSSSSSSSSSSVNVGLPIAPLTLQEHSNLSMPVPSLYSQHQQQDIQAFALQNDEQQQQQQRLQVDHRRASIPSPRTVERYSAAYPYGVPTSVSGQQQFFPQSWINTSSSSSSQPHSSVPLLSQTSTGIPYSGSSSSSSPSHLSPFDAFRQSQVDTSLIPPVPSSASPLVADQTMAMSSGDGGMSYSPASSSSSSLSFEETSGPSHSSRSARSEFELASNFRARTVDSKESVPACDFCRKRKVKCDRVQPTCSFCSKHGVECTTRDRLRKRGPPTREQRSEMKEAGYSYDRSKRRWRLTGQHTITTSLSQASMSTDAEQQPLHHAQRTVSTPNLTFASQQDRARMAGEGGGGGG